MKVSVAKYPVLVLGLTGVAFSCIKTGRDSIFFSDTGLAELPAAYFWTEIGLGVAAYIHLSAMKKFGSRRTRLGVFVLCAALFLAFVPFARADYRFLVQLLFPLVPTVFAAMFANAWLLAGDLLEGAEQKVVQRVYTFVGASAMVGGILGGLLAKAAAVRLDAGGLIGLGGAVLFLAAVVAARAHAAHPVDPAERAAVQVGGPISAEGRDALAFFKEPYTRRLLAISALGTLTAMYVEFQFYAAAFASGRAGPNFFADYYVILCVASLALQIVIAPWVQSRFGLARTLLVLPAGVLGGAGMVAFTTTVITQSLYRVLETALKNSIHRSSWEQVFLKYDRERRAAVKVMIDGTVPRLAGVLGAVALWIVIELEGTSVVHSSVWPIWVLLPVSAIWVYTTSVLARPQESAAKPDLEPATECRIRVPDS